MALAKGPARHTRSGDNTPVACLATIAYCHIDLLAHLCTYKRGPQWEVTQGLYEKMQSAFQDAPLGLSEQEEQVHELGADVCTHLWGERQEGLHDWVRRYEGHKLGVDHLHLVHLLRHKICIQLVRNGLRLLCGGGRAQIVGGCAEITSSKAAQEIDSSMLQGLGVSSSGAS